MQKNIQLLNVFTSMLVLATTSPAYMEMPHGMPFAYFMHEFPQFRRRRSARCNRDTLAREILGINPASISEDPVELADQAQALVDYFCGYTERPEWLSRIPAKQEQVETIVRANVFANPDRLHRLISESLRIESDRISITSDDTRRVVQIDQPNGEPLICAVNVTVGDQSTIQNSSTTSGALPEVSRDIAAGAQQEHAANH